MGSSNEDIQDQSGDTGSNATLPARDPLASILSLQSSSNIQREDQFVSGNGHATKVRKPYTVTKQRERWTEEEHKKFLEALKLYGRAWRRIEEHVGTKTAVQIRSHAQKFFSKVVRDSSSNEDGMEKPIEIPPPRPKRKPMHPYPRKMISSVKPGARLSDESKHSLSPNMSISGRENQSPTSVFSAVGSDATGVTDSGMPNCSLSPASCDADDQRSSLFPSETIPSPEENGSENGSSSPAQGNDDLTQDDVLPTKLELFPGDGGSSKEDSYEQTSTRSLKLFGKTLIVTEAESPNMWNCNSQASEVADEIPAQESSWNLFSGVRLSPTDEEHAMTGILCEAPAVYYMQFQNESSNGWAFYGGVPFPLVQLHRPLPEKVHFQDKKVPKDYGSWSSSNAGSVNAAYGGDKTWDVETQSRQPIFVKEESQPKVASVLKTSDRVAITKQKKGLVSSAKGFVPYKRCLAERESQSTLSGEDGEERRVRLCL